MSDSYPKHLAKDMRAWRRMKRREWRAIQKSVDAFSLGSSYTPIYSSAFRALRDALADGAKALSPKRWGR